jgi:hypothetical protein
VPPAFTISVGPEWAAPRQSKESGGAASDGTTAEQYIAFATAPTVNDTNPPAAIDTGLAGEGESIAEVSGAKQSSAGASASVLNVRVSPSASGMLSGVAARKPLELTIDIDFVLTLVLRFWFWCHQSVS